MKKLANIIAFAALMTIQLSAQSGNSDCGMEDFPPPSENLSGNCITNSIWNNAATYIPVDQDITALTIKLNFIFWQRQDGIIGNFQENNTDHNFFLDEVINEMNRRISNLVDPQNAVCYGGNPDYLKDSKIRFDVRKYYIPDGYLWDIENATPNATNNFYCPGAWDQAYTDLAYQRLAENNVRNGLNVFFGTEGSAFQALLIDQLTGDYNSVATGIDCSEWPGGQNNLAKRLRVEMTNEYLKYEFRYNFTQDPFWQLSFEDLKHSLARSTLHELGHSFDLQHNTSCPNGANIMDNAGDSDRNYLQSSQIGIMLKNAHLTSVRQYVRCELAGDKPRVLTGNHVWAFDTKVYTDIILEPGAELRICGNVYMPDRGYIHVKRGAKLIVDEGKISLNREEYDDCPDAFWGGIVLWGNSSKPHDEVDINNLQLNDPGVVILENNALIEYAHLGINAFRFATSFPDDPFPEYYGGIVQADDSSFKDCRQVASFSPFAFENDSYFKNCTFFSDDGSALGGITAYGIQHLDIENCSFNNLGSYGIRLINSGANIFNGCTFTQMTHGIYAFSTNPQTASITIGSFSDLLTRNSFSQNTCGIYSFGISNLDVIKNDFTLNNFGMAIKGETGVLSYDNNYDQLLVGEQFEQSGILEKNSFCNIYSNNFYGIYALGNNPGFTFNNNAFSDTDPNFDNYDLIIKPKETAVGITNGSIYNFQGSPGNAVFNLFSDNANATSIYAKIGETETFNYYAPSNPSDPRLIPDCSLNNPGGCSEVFNYYVLDTDGQPEACLGLGGLICNTENCLTDKYLILRSLQATIDGGDTQGLLDALVNAPTGSSTKQNLLNSSPYLSDEVMSVMLQSLMLSADRGEILLANAPLSDNILLEANGKIPQTDFQNLQSIKATNPVSARDELYHSITLASNEKDKVLYANVERYAQLGDHISIENLLLQDNTDLAIRTLIGLKAEWGEISEAQSLWQNLPASTIAEQEAKDVLDINIQRHAVGEGFVLDATQEATLYSIAEGQSPQAAYAMGLLGLLKEEVFVPELPAQNTALSQPVNNGEIQINIEKENAVIRFYPNPANDKVQINIPLYLDELLTVTINNLFGQELQLIPFENTGILEVDLTDFPAGIFIVSIRKEDKLLRSQKLLKN